MSQEFAWPVRASTMWIQELHDSNSYKNRTHESGSASGFGPLHGVSTPGTKRHAYNAEFHDFSITASSSFELIRPLAGAAGEPQSSCSLWPLV